MLCSSALLAYGDKAILAAFVVVLTGAAANLVTADEHEAARAELEQSLATVQEHTSSRPSAPLPAAPRWSETLRDELATPPPVPAAFPAWNLERRPGFLFGLVPAAQPPEFAHAAATAVTADSSERGRVVVRWQAGTTQNLLLSHAVERRLGDDGAWEPLGEVVAAATELVDASPDARTRYAYRVVTTATVDDEDPRVVAARRAGTFDGLDPSLVRRESEPSPTVVTPAELFIVPLSVSTASHPDRTTAYVVVHRWDRAARRFASTRLQVKVGQRLDSGLVVEEIAEGNALSITLRTPTGELLTEDSRRDRLPPELRGRQ